MSRFRVRKKIRMTLSADMPYASSPASISIPRILLFGLLATVPLGPVFSEETVDFVEEIYPIFEERCLSCHGPEKQKSGLRLDSRESVFAGGDYGAFLVPGDSSKSPAIGLLDGSDPDILMPPKGDPLSAEQIDLIRKWIDQGAEWPEGFPIEATASVAVPQTVDHWAFKKPVRPETPAVQREGWVGNPIDAFVLARLEKEGKTPSPQAERHTLLRRLSFDLIGLPPTPEELDAFLSDTSEKAYENAVDRLLASPHFGERWARWWLDAARYADTNGYEKDRPRSIWPYRDWVINSFNENLPFDTFAIEQIAGDMLPGAEQSQRVATGFHRNTMTNEEGGIDVEEFRFESMVDRVHTTATTFLGLTMTCCQCHDHKYDPILQREYWQMFAFLNNADEPEIEIKDRQIERQRNEILEQIEAIESTYEDRFPPYEERIEWTVLDPTRFRSDNGAVLAKLEDSSLLALGPNPATDVYRIGADLAPGQYDALQLEVLAEERLGEKGVGRTGHGNFVLSEIDLRTKGGERIEIESASADFSQDSFEIARAIDGDPDSGWAIDGPKDLSVPRTAEFRFANPLQVEPGDRLEIDLRQFYGGGHNIRRLKLSAGRLERLHYREDLPEAEQRKAHLLAKFEDWKTESEKKARNWTVVEPTSFESAGGATLRQLSDNSILARGDRPNRDTFVLECEPGFSSISGIRLETLPHFTLPNYGPGRGSVMDDGSFLLTEFVVVAQSEGVNDTTLELVNPTSTFHSGSDTIDRAIDGVFDTGWGIRGGMGKAHTAVFEVSGTHEISPGTRLVFRLEQNFIHQQTIGRFRVSLTGDEGPVAATGFDADVEMALATSASDRSEEQKASLLETFLSVTPELDGDHKKIADLRTRLPKFPTTLVLAERPPDHPRKTHIHVRGEFLRTGKEVYAGVPAVLHPLPENGARDRLTFARWLASEENPLIGRVTMNRLWNAFFGRGLVHTAEDFGTQGDLPSHPDLLDYLATEFTLQGWDFKEMCRQIVTSSTYKQSSKTTPKEHAVDPDNLLLARGPRVRVDAEMIRDMALSVSGLLSPEIGGPSVFPPQPDGVLSLAYGGFQWNTSDGADRYRRGLYTHMKRGAPYPGMTVFDSALPETCRVKRRRSNTPLQALTLLNDEVYIEAAQALASRVVEEASAEVDERIKYACRLVLCRAPSESQVEKLTSFYESQLERLSSEEVPADRLAKLNPRTVDHDAPAELAAWTLVARTLLNLDEAITKE